jgi:hypothetical protein
MKLDHPVFDCDNHYYEALDAFTRHLDPRLGGRCVQWAEIGGRKYHVIAGRVPHAVTNPTFNPIAKPGAMHEYFRGNPNGKSPIEFLREREPIPAEYRERIFEEFGQVEGQKEGKKHSTGLGLTFCKLAAEAQFVNRATLADAGHHILKDAPAGMVEQHVIGHHRGDLCGYGQIGEAVDTQLVTRPAPQRQSEMRRAHLHRTA